MNATRPVHGSWALPTAVPMWLRVDEGSEQTLLVCVDEDSVIGRDLQCAVVVHDDEASRLHARLTPSVDGWTVTDLATTNGTFVNGERIVGPAKVGAGDVISVGRARCRVVEPPA